MGALSSFKVLICIGLFSICLLISPGCAASNETRSMCKEGEEQDEQEEPECCIFNMMKEERQGKVCAELPSDRSVAVAITLIVSFTFLISLQCFMHHHVEDMREHAYTVISSTVSIFSAVLAFQCIDAIVKDFIISNLEQVTGEADKVDLIVDFLHMLLWYIATQLTIAYVSCALRSDEWRADQLAAAAVKQKHEGDLNMMLNIEINSVSYGIVLAHLTGFAAINFWTELQQVNPFNESPLLTLVPVPIAVLTQLLFEKISDCWRNSYIAMDGNKDWFENMWDEKCQEAEDDIMGLTLSVMIVNSLRYVINERHGHKCLPNSEQKEEGPTCEFNHSTPEVLWLNSLGLIFVTCLFVTKYIFVKISDRQEAAKKAEETTMRRRESLRVLSKQKTCHTKIRRALEKVMEGDLGDSAHRGFSGGCDLDEAIDRAEDVILTVFGMAHSWCVFHGTHEALIFINPSFLGQPQNSMTLSVVLALGVTYIGFAAIRILERIAALPDEWTPHEVDDSIRTVISAMSIFIGFAWEQTFDEAVGQLAERTRFNGGQHAPAIARMLLGSGCIGVVFSAWKWFILPFVFRKGWRFGYVFSRKDLNDRCEELASHDPNFSFEHLQGVAKKLADKAEAYKSRFLPSEDASPSRFDHFPSEHASPCSEGYKSLPCGEFEAMRTECQEMKFLSRLLEQQLEDERRSKSEAMRLEIRDLFVKERCGEIESMRTEIQELRSHKKMLEQQLEKRSMDIEAMRKENVELQIHTRFLEEQLNEQRGSDIEAMRTEIEGLRIQLADEKKAGEESKVHRRYLERLLLEEREARQNLEKHHTSMGEDLLNTEGETDDDSFTPFELEDGLKEDLRKAMTNHPQRVKLVSSPFSPPRDNGSSAERPALPRSLASIHSKLPQDRGLVAELPATPLGPAPSRSQPTQSSVYTRIPNRMDNAGIVGHPVHLQEPKRSPSGFTDRQERRKGLKDMLSASGSPVASHRL